MREMLIQLDVDAGDRRWQERANCLGVDPDLFFPERGASTKEAKSVCGGCEVRMECLEYALAPRREVRDLGRDVRAGTAPDPSPARARPPRSRQRLTLAATAARGAGRPATTGDRARYGPRSSTSRRSGSTRGSRRVHRSSSRRGINPTSSTAATSVPDPFRELAHVQARVLDAGPVDVGEVHRHLRRAARRARRTRARARPAIRRRVLADHRARSGGRRRRRDSRARS